MRFLYQLYKVLSSYWLAALTLFFMTVVTLVGTMDQVDLGLWGAKQRYFHSFFTSYKGVPLPGGLLLMMLLFVNMALGGMVHVRKESARPAPLDLSLWHVISACEWFRHLDANTRWLCGLVCWSSG